MSYKKCNCCKQVKPTTDFKVGDFICKECKDDTKTK